MILDLLKDLWGFMKVRKKFWLMPIFFFILLLSLMVMLGQNPVIAPFIYTLF